MYWTDVANQVLIFAIMAMSLNLLLGYTGQISVAHAAFAAIGGYASGYLALKYGWSIGTAIVFGMVLAFVIGVLISIPALLLSSEYLILLTLSVQTIILVLISSVAALGGLYGLTGLPTPNVLGKELLRPSDWFMPLLIATGIVFAVLTWIGQSPFGRVLRGIREDQLATQSLGKDVFVRKVVVFGLTSAIAAFGGALFGLYNGTVSPPLYGFSMSILLVAMVVLGGRGNMLGSVLGAGVVIGAQPFFEKVIELEPSKAALVRLLCFGLLLVIVLMVRPQGLLPEGATPGALIGRLRRRRNPEAASALSAEELATELAAGAGTQQIEDARPVVEVDGVRKSFGGIKAVDGLSFELLEGRVTGLIGPNGAGKTTVFNLLTGAIPPDEGTVRLYGEDITAWPIDRVARHGMVRSFQDVRAFPGMTVLDNVRMAVPNQRGETLRDLFLTPWRVIADQRRTRELAQRALGFVGLADRQHVTVATLPFGEQKLVALARILAADAKVLLLDEPASGIDAQWVDRMVEIIRRMRDHGLTICIVEHNLHVVERVADRIYFMEAGRISAGGTMQELVEDERLVEVYFGQP
jgi:branched-chain amino acid transport system permease protein